MKSELDDSRVSNEESDGARNMEKPDESSDEAFRELGLELGFEFGRLVPVDLRPDRGVLVIARAIAVIEAGSFSGGEAFHLSSGPSSDHSGFACCGMSMAPSIGDASPDDDRTLPRRRALASQFEI